MNITLQPELFKTPQFQASFKEKLKSAKYHDYDGLVTLSKEETKHYYYGRAVKGILAEMAVYGYLMSKKASFLYNRKTDKRKYAPDIDMILLPSKQRIDVKSGFSFWKKLALVKQNIDYIIVAQPLIEHKPEVYRRWNYTLVKSYRQLFKSPITVSISGYITVDDYLLTNDQTLKPIEELF